MFDLGNRLRYQYDRLLPFGEILKKRVRDKK
jgi:hypothetical protein